MTYLVLLCSLLFSLCGLAFDRVSFATSAGTREQQMSLDAARFWQVASSKFFIGLGLRGTSQWSVGQTYTTAPALITTGQEGPQVIFLEDKKNNIDELTLNNSQVTSLNIAFHLLYQFNDTWSFGTNIDLIGGSFGKSHKAKYNPHADDASYPDTVTARPSPFNLLLISDNDIGYLNSEFYVRKSLGKNWGIKAGANFAFTEYTTKQKLRKGNDRFRHKSLLPTIGLTRDF